MWPLKQCSVCSALKQFDQEKTHIKKINGRLTNVVAFKVVVPMEPNSLTTAADLIGPDD